MQSTDNPITDAKDPDHLSSLRNFLRVATANLHTNLDRKIAPLLTGDERAYRHFLQRTALVLLPLEQALQVANVAGLLTDWPQRRRSDALISDLHSLQMNVPQAQTLVISGDEAQILGMLYVLEGSRLGAEHLLKIVSKSDSPTIRSATSYLAHGAGESLWQSFLMHLERSHHAQTHRDITLAGATLVFTMFSTAFSGSWEDNE